MILLAISRCFDLLSEHVCGPISFSSIFAIIVRRRLTRPAPAEFVIVLVACCLGHPRLAKPSRSLASRSSNQLMGTLIS
jgi:hypothetical protein